MKFQRTIIVLFSITNLLSNGVEAQEWGCKGDPYFPEFSGSNSPFDATVHPHSVFYVNEGGNYCDRDNYDYLDGTNIVWENLYSGKGWSLIVNEEFNGTNLNKDIWRGSPIGNNYPPKDQMGAIVPENSTVANGHLIQVGNYDPDLSKEYLVYNNWIYPPIAPHMEHFDYTQPGIDSKFLLTPPVWIQIRCKTIPDAHRNWAAFWMYGAAKNGYEIDGFEIRDDPRYSYDDWYPAAFMKMTYHAAKYGQALPDPNNANVKAFAADYYQGGDFNATFHTYDIIWDNYRIEWKLDGQPILKQHKYYAVNGNVGPKENFRDEPLDNYTGVVTSSRYAVNPYYPDKSQPMNLILGFGIQEAGGSYSGVDMQTDYVKVWKATPCGDNVTLSSLNFDFIDYGDGRGFITQNGLTLNTVAGSPNMIVPVDYYANFTAIDEIGLQDGFGVEAGGYFEGFITTCFSYAYQRESETQQTVLAPPQSNNLNGPSLGNFNTPFVKIVRSETGYVIRSFTDRLKAIEVYDLNGSLAFKSDNINTYESEINRNSLSAGVYLFRIYSTQEVYVSKVFIE